jgi:hypothetical protein
VKSHVWRPLYLVLGVIALVLLVREIVVPKDFGIHERGYMYGWHRKSNEAEWKAVSVKYNTTANCKKCHEDKYLDIKDSPHGGIMCENCHGPGGKHPEDPKTLNIDRSRELCSRCHARLPYPGSGRGKIKGINPATHHPEVECVLCHYPHNPKRPASKEVKR